MQDFAVVELTYCCIVGGEDRVMLLVREASSGGLVVVISQRRRPISGSFVDVVEVSKALSQREIVAKVTETRARLIPRPEAKGSSLPRVPYFTHEWLTYPSDTVKRCQLSQLIVK